MFQSGPNKSFSFGNKCGSEFIKLQWLSLPVSSSSSSAAFTYELPKGFVFSSLLLCPLLSLLVTLNTTQWTRVKIKTKYVKMWSRTITLWFIFNFDFVFDRKGKIISASCFIQLGNIPAFLSSLTEAALFIQATQKSNTAASYSDFNQLTFLHTLYFYWKKWCKSVLGEFWPVYLSNWELLQNTKWSIKGQVHSLPINLLF